MVTGIRLFIICFVAGFYGDVLAGKELPNRVLTPGAINREVTQDNLKQTICSAGWTKTIRPPVAYTSNLKKYQLEQYGYADKKLSHYEEDHLISLQLGGDARDPRNLWPQPYAGKCGARVKDVVETKLKRLVCAGQVTLAVAQKEISSNWVLAYRRRIAPLSCD